MAVSGQVARLSFVNTSQKSFMGLSHFRYFRIISGKKFDQFGAVLYISKYFCFVHFELNRQTVVYVN